MGANASKAAVLGVIIAGGFGVLVRNTTADPSLIAFARVLIGSVLLLAFLTLTRQRHHLRRRPSPQLVVASIAVPLMILAYTSTIRLTTIANAVLMLYLGPVLATALAPLFLRDRANPARRERASVASVALLCVALAGLTLLLGTTVSPEDRPSLPAILWGGAGAICYATHILASRATPTEEVAYKRAFYHMVIGCVVMLPVVVGRGGDFEPSDVGWLIAIGFLTGFLAITLISYGLMHLKTHVFAVLTFVEPVAAAAFGWLLFSEGLSVLQVAGGTTVVASGMLQAVIERKGV